jgi:hypothetical protein
LVARSAAPFGDAPKVDNPRALIEDARLPPRLSAPCTPLMRVGSDEAATLW